MNYGHVREVFIRIQGYEGEGNELLRCQDLEEALLCLLARHTTLSSVVSMNGGMSGANGCKTSSTKRSTNGKSASTGSGRRAGK